MIKLIFLKIEIPFWLIVVTIILLCAAGSTAVSGVAAAKNNQITLEKIASFDNEKDKEIFNLKQSITKYGQRIYHAEGSVKDLTKDRANWIINQEKMIEENEGLKLITANAIEEKDSYWNTIRSLIDEKEKLLKELKDLKKNK